MASFTLNPRIAPHSQFANRVPFLSKPITFQITLKSKKTQIRLVSAAAPHCDLHVVRRDRIGNVAGQDKAGEGNKIAAEKLDRWMRGSVEEIIKNLTKAPLLVHVYSEEEYGEKAKIRTESAVVSEWPAVKGEWESGEKRSPDGLIFVEELREEEGEVEEGVTRAWGVVVQGRGAECGPACYLLKTSSVGAGIGMGLFCTHFCLVRVKSFRESAFCQFKNCWLLQ